MDLPPLQAISSTTLIMEKEEKIMWRLVCVMERIMILFKALSFGNLVVPSFMSWVLLRFPLGILLQSPLSWPTLNYVVSTTVYYSFTNSALLTWILGSTQTRREIHDLGFDYYIKILEEFEGMFYFDLFMPILMGGGCLGWLAAIVAFWFSLAKSSNMKNQIKLIMAKWEDEDDDNKTEENKEQLSTEAMKAEDVVPERSREDERKKKEEEERREEMMRKVMEKWKKEKIRRNAYRVKWEKEKKENARLSRKLSTDGTRWVEFWKIYGERRKWEEERREEMMRKVMEKWKKEKIRRKAYRVKWEKEKKGNARLSRKLSTDRTRWVEFWKIYGERRKWEEERREEMMRKVMEKWKKEKIRRNAYKVKWEKEKEENARLSGKLSTDGTRRVEFWKIYGERRKWEEERRQLVTKLSTVLEESHFYEQLLGLRRTVGMNDF